MSVLATYKGWLGEIKARLAQALLLDDRVYHSVNNITIPFRNGTTQIDHVIVSRFGIFVVETKNMMGWIYGSSNSKQWTQSLYGQKHRFQNPLHQNHLHVLALAELLDLDTDKFHPIVMFWGDAKLKTSLPENVLTQGYIRYIKSKTTVLLSDGAVLLLVDALRNGMLPRTRATQQTHVAFLKRRHKNNASVSN